MEKLKQEQKDREKLLYEILKYSSYKKEFNPEFKRSELIKLLNWDIGKFAKIQKSLGDKYCLKMREENEDSIYRIQASECWQLQEGQGDVVACCAKNSLTSVWPTAKVPYHATSSKVGHTWCPAPHHDKRDQPGRDF